MKLRLILLTLMIAAASVNSEAKDCALAPISGPHATLVVYRLRMLLDSGRHSSIYLDEQKVCSLTNGRYLVIDVPEGEHRLRSSDDKHGGAVQTFLPGQVFFYRIHYEQTSFTQMRNFWVLDPVLEAEARKELGILRAQDGETKSLPDPPKQ
jgi:hypothetical protein